MGGSHGGGGGGGGGVSGGGVEKCGRVVRERNVVALLRCQAFAYVTRVSIGCPPLLTRTQIDRSGDLFGGVAYYVRYAFYAMSSTRQRTNTVFSTECLLMTESSMSRSLVQPQLERKEREFLNGKF
jgi:hypothetical protein